MSSLLIAMNIGEFQNKNKKNTNAKISSVEIKIRDNRQKNFNWVQTYRICAIYLNKSI